MRINLPGGGSMPPPTFKNLITELAATALVCLGVLDSPITKQKAPDLSRAKHLIDMLAMLQNKTAGNLEPLEADYIDAVVDDLREKYRNARGGAAGQHPLAPGASGVLEADPDDPDEPPPPVFGAG